jgi:transglutaminase-like putative cysteine protease
MSRTSLALLLPSLVLYSQGPTRDEALKMLDGPGSVEARVGRLVTYLQQRMPFVATDYRNRSVEEILARGAGNCADHARVLRSLLEARGIQVRWVQEINLQAGSTERQQSAARKVREKGPGMSVFGYRHNDHRWLEVQDREQGRWFPADSSLGVSGIEAWIDARLGFAGRPPAVAEMQAPVFVEAVPAPGEKVPRSSTYLIEGFGRTYQGRLRALPAWEKWVQAVRALEPVASAAFAGKSDLHSVQALFDELAASYQSLRSQAQEAGISPAQAPR